MLKRYYKHKLFDRLLSGHHINHRKFTVSWKPACFNRWKKTNRRILIRSQKKKSFYK